VADVGQRSQPLTHILQKRISRRSAFRTTNYGTTDVQFRDTSRCDSYLLFRHNVHYSIDRRTPRLLARGARCSPRWCWLQPESAREHQLEPVGGGGSSSSSSHSGRACAVVDHEHRTRCVAPLGNSVQAKFTLESLTCLLHCTRAHRSQARSRGAAIEREYARKTSSTGW